MVCTAFLWQQAESPPTFAPVLRYWSDESVSNEGDTIQCVPQFSSSYRDGNRRFSSYQNTRNPDSL